MPIEINALETARFGIIAARIIDAQATPDEIDAASRDKDVQMLTVRIEASDLTRVHAFEAAGYQLMDTLVYYGRSLDDLPPKRAEPEGISCRKGLAQDAEAVARVAHVAFAGYMGHYHSDPRLDPAAADAAYVEWAKNSTVHTSPTAPVFVAENDGQIVGFITLRHNSEDGIEIALNAVQPDQQGQGLYEVLLAYTLNHAHLTGARRVMISTQINNYAVQRVWSRLGFIHERSLYTFHKWV